MSDKVAQVDRVLELLRMFNEGKKVCISTLQTLQMWENKSEKTIRRDLDIIKKYFPESFELIRGEKGCYRATTNELFNNLTNKNNISVFIQILNLSQNNASILDTLEIDDEDKKRIKQLLKDKNKCYDFITKPYEDKKIDDKLLKQIESAINFRKCVTIKYIQNNELITRDIKPYKIIFLNQNFYLVAENIPVEPFTVSTYRLSNIKSIKHSSKEFRCNLDINDYIADIQTPFSTYTTDYKAKRVEVILQVDKAKAKFFKMKKFFKSQEIQSELEDGTLIIKYKFTQTLEIESFIKEWIPFVKVISPLSLKKKIDDDVKIFLQ